MNIALVVEGPLDTPQQGKISKLGLGLVGVFNKFNRKIMALYLFIL